MEILDSTVLSNFARIGRLDLLQLDSSAVYTTTAKVKAELQIGELLDRIPKCDWNWLPIIDLLPEEIRLFKEFSQRLDEGEAACLAIALMRRAVIVTDDQAARRFAAGKGIVVSGTLGVLRRLVRTEYLSESEGDELLSQMIERGYRSPVRSLQDLAD